MKFRVTNTKTFGPFSGDYDSESAALPDMGKNYYWKRERNGWELMGRRRGFPAMLMGTRVEIVEG